MARLRKPLGTVLPARVLVQLIELNAVCSMCRISTRIADTDCFKVMNETSRIIQ